MDDDEETASVTIVSQVFHPDSSANSVILSELATGLADRGVDVSVLTAQPSYTADDRSERHPRHETYEGVDICRIPSTRFDRNEGTVWRMLNEVTFFVSAFFALLLCRRDADVVLLPTAPTFLPVLGWLAKPFGGPAYVPVVMDFYPDMAVQLGYLSESGTVYRVWDRLNERAYRASATAVTIGDTMRRTLRRKYGESFPIEVIHNWEDGERIRPQAKTDNEFSLEHGFLDETTLLYSGNLGRHHDLESLVEAATRLDSDELDRPAHFVLIGEGGKKAPLEALVERRRLDTVTFLPYQPVGVLPDSLTSGDVAVVTMEPSVEGLCVSSKFYTALASGQAVLAIATPDSEIGTVVERTDCGIRVDPKSPEQVADAVRYWDDRPEELARMGRRAREVFEASFTRDTAVQAYLEVVRSVEA